MRFAKLKDNYEKEVYVNTDRVNFVRQYNEDSTEVNCGKDHSILVKMSASAVVSIIAKAGKGTWE